MLEFVPSTIGNILADVRSIASASDFGQFVAQRTAEQIQVNASTNRNSRDPTQFFPQDPDASTIDALLDKVAELAPLHLPREKDGQEHTWLSCIRECAKNNCAFTDRNHPRNVDVNCRLVDVLISCFKMEPEIEGSNATRTSLEDRAAKDDATRFTFVARTLVELMSYVPQQCSGASDALTDFLIQGITSKHCTLCDRYRSSEYRTQTENILVQSIFQSASPGKWIAQLAITGHLISSIRSKFFDFGSTFPPSLGDPEGIRLLFRSLHIARKKNCCSDVPELLEKILGNIRTFQPKLFNTPLNLLDDEGVLIDDTMLGIASQGTHYCEQYHRPLWQKLVWLGADVNGLVEDPADPTKKIVSRRDGKTPAMLACATGHDEIVSFFVYNKDLDLTLKDNEGKRVADHLLRRRECKKEHLQRLYNRNPALFEQHVTFAHLDFAVRNGLHDTVVFLLSLESVRFEVSQLQELCNFCFHVFRHSDENVMKNPELQGKRCATKERNDVLHRDWKRRCEDCHEFSFARTCIQHLTWKLYELGSHGPTMSFARRRDRVSAEDDAK